MSKADIIRLNQQWIIKAEKQIVEHNREIALFELDIKGYRNAIARLEEGDEEEI
jgi:hypothetical protein